MKTFRIRDPQVLARFEALCKSFKLKEQDVLDSMFRKWIEENEKTIRLDNFLKGETTINIIQPQTVNIAVKAELTYVKVELSRILGALETCSVESRPDFLRDLAKTILRASRIRGATEDPELEELLAKAETHLKRQDAYTAAKKSPTAN
mgnify:CR=1 FL=1